MRIAIIHDDAVVNIIEADDTFLPDDGTRAIPAGEAGPGWTYDGDAFHPPPDEPAVPGSVSMFRAREALRRTKGANGGTLLDDVATFIDARSGDEPTLALAWEYATDVARDGLFVTTLAKHLRLDDDALDALFRLAATIQA